MLFCSQRSKQTTSGIENRQRRIRNKNIRTLKNANQDVQIAAETLNRKVHVFALELHLTHGDYQSYKLPTIPDVVELQLLEKYVEQHNLVNNNIDSASETTPKIHRLENTQLFDVAIQR